MKKIRISERLLAIALNVLIGVLLFTVFLQCGVYLRQYARIRAEDSEIPFDMRMLSASASDAGSVLQADLLTPAMIAVSENGTAHAVLHSAVVIGDLYEELAPFLADCLAQTPTYVNDTMWQLAITSPKAVYVRYHGELPYQIVHAFASAAAGEENYLHDPTPVGVQELCLRLTGETAHLLVRGSAGVYSFSAPLTNPSATFSHYVDDYREVFCLCTLTGTARPAAMLTERVETRNISVSTGVAAQIAGSESHFTSWLRAFRFNPDKLNYHTEPDGTTVYVESHGILSWGTDRITYTASEGGGVAVDEFCTPYEIDLYTYLRAASAFLSEVSSMHIYYTGGDAVPRLTSVTAAGDSVTLHFGLFADNLPVYYNGESTRISMTFTGEFVTEVVWQPVQVSKQLTERSAPLEAWSRSVFGTSEVRLAYRAEESRSTVGAEWVAHRTEE